MHGHRARDWLSQAENDLLYARSALRDGFYSQTCFICQQAAEKALKAMAYASGAKAVLSHSLHKLCMTLNINGDLLDAAKILDQYYVAARYPDALAAGAPHEVFTKRQAEEAVGYAALFIDAAVAAGTSP